MQCDNALPCFALLYVTFLTNMHFDPRPFILDHGSIEGSNNRVIGRIRRANMKGCYSERQRLSACEVNLGKLKARKTTNVVLGSPGILVIKLFVLDRMVIVLFGCGGIYNLWVVNNEKNHSLALCFHRFRGDPPKINMNFDLLNSMYRQRV